MRKEIKRMRDEKKFMADSGVDAANFNEQLDVPRDEKCGNKDGY